MAQAAAPARAANNPDQLIPDLTPNLWMDVSSLEKTLIAQDNQTNFPKELSRLVASYLKRVWFDADACRKFFGDPGPVPRLPANMDLVLAQPNPFNPQNQVGDDFALALVPASITRTTKTDQGTTAITLPVTLNTAEYFAKNPLEGSGLQYRYYGQAAALHGETASKTSRYVLLSKTVIEGSRNQTYAAQKALMAQKGLGLYQVPSARIVAFVIFGHCLLTERLAIEAKKENPAGERLYSDDDPVTYTRCVEEVNDDPVVVGGFTAGGGPHVFSRYHPFEYIGAGALRKVPLDIGN